MMERLPDHPPEYDVDPMEEAAAELADKIINELGYPAAESGSPEESRPNYVTRQRMVEIAVEILEAWDAEFP